MKKAILIFVLIFIVLIPNIFAIPTTTFRRTLANGTSISTNPSDYFNNSIGKFCGGGLFFKCAGFNNQSLYYNDTGSHNDYRITFDHVNMSIAGNSEFLSGKLAPAIQVGDCIDMRVRRSADTGNANWFIGIDDDAVLNDGLGVSQVGEVGGVNPDILTYTPNAEVWTSTTHAVQYGSYMNLTFEILSTTNVVLYPNNSNNGLQNFTTPSLSLLSNFSFGVLSQVPTDILSIDHLVVYNCSTGAPQSPAETGPPEITSYTVSTPTGDCTTWNTNKSNPCNITDTTPTVTINTNEPATCAIGLSDLNYTDLGANRGCSGGGSSQHSCTLITQDELIYEISYVYIGCKDNNGNENKTSTSGALRFSLSETPFIDAIETGIRNALLSSYTIYTNQRVYARNSANSQFVGTFDKVAKKQSKIWVFNRIAISESSINPFNITPVLYTFEFINKTTVYIENQTALLINATK